MTILPTTSTSYPRAQRSHGAHHHHHHHDHSLKSGYPLHKEADRIEIQLIDLDDLRDPTRISIKETTCLSHITNFLKRRYADWDNYDGPVSRDAQIIYYCMDKRLLGDEIPRNISRLHYRALKSDFDDGDESAIRISWAKKVQLNSEQAAQMHATLEKGETVGGLRRTLAALLDVEDPHRIVMTAVGGLRPGDLQGNNWKAAMIKSWLCHEIRIDVAPENGYLILKGVNEEYIYHPPSNYAEPSVDLGSLRQWLRYKILTNVHRRASSRLNVDSEDITLVCKGKLLKRRRHVPLGQTVEFELTRNVTDKFTAEEAWLLPLTTSCVVCGDDKRASEIPSSITKSCEHDATTCKECIGQWIASSMDTVAWDRLRCPECPQLLRFEDVQAFATRETFERYDSLATKAAVSNIPNFKWCLNPRCQTGQIIRTGCDKVKCYSCKASSCAIHDLPWHKGETCEDFDVRNRRQRKNEKASKKTVKEITKPCPQCHRDVHKFSGCDHITCICGHEWCYLCLSTYFHDEQSLLQCKHKTDCKYFENPPMYEGGRAFMPFLNQDENMNMRNFLDQHNNFNIDGLLAHWRQATEPNPPPREQWQPLNPPPRGPEQWQPVRQPLGQPLGQPLPTPRHNPFQPEPNPQEVVDDQNAPPRGPPNWRGPPFNPPNPFHPEPNPQNGENARPREAHFRGAVRGFHGHVDYVDVFDRLLHNMTMNAFHQTPEEHFVRFPPPYMPTFQHARRRN